MTTQICPHCGTAVPGAAQFCVECGSNLAATGETVRLPTRRCAGCGGEGPATAEACPACGRAYAARKETESSARPLATPVAPQQSGKQTHQCGGARSSRTFSWWMVPVVVGVLVAFRQAQLIPIAMLALFAVMIFDHNLRQGQLGQRVGTFVFLAGMIILFATKVWWWPGILVVIFAAMTASWLARQVQP